MTSLYILQLMEKKEMSDVNVRMIENVSTCDVDVDALEVKARLAGFA